MHGEVELCACVALVQVLAALLQSGKILNFDQTMNYLQSLLNKSFQYW